jgi:hypothetical protein
MLLLTVDHVYRLVVSETGKPLARASTVVSLVATGRIYLGHSLAVTRRDSDVIIRRSPSPLLLSG